MSKHNNFQQFAQNPNGIAIPSDIAQDQLANVQRNMLRVQAAIEIMGKVTSIAYMEATNSARTAKFTEIKNKIKSESPEFITEEEINQKAADEFNRTGQQVEMRINLNQCADLSVQAAETLLKRLGVV